ncbi:hypothetical protein E2C01_043425 [Portunus trituberculatus]|uniref:Uncharacterized protein n=1 Tax=Portunus trituberculatus TaxID=210409 RepID=A0A5B7FW49_PORTR|nr:hypothetical protein [Portunus trituberculatus]
MEGTGTGIRKLHLPASTQVFRGTANRLRKNREEGEQEETPFALAIPLRLHPMSNTGPDNL